ncbi:MAG: 2-oxo acid dehydrogenase subunit E2 [Clostridiales bacterium]|nr:2-oxo acid dehydrogenase subunit E2 [Clostridiales bacterium]
MASAVVMPKAGITVETCIMGKWEKKVGDRVNPGDILFTYETDKASFECESTAEGELLEIFFREGDEVPVLVNVCAIGEKGEDVSSLRPDAAGLPDTTAVQTSTAERPSPADDLSAETVKSTHVDGQDSKDAESETGILKISPRARNLAERSGADVRLAVPTGPHGRIIERDIRTLLESGAALKAEGDAPGQAAGTSTAAAELRVPESIGYKDVKFSGIRRAIAKAMHSSLSSMAQLTHHHTFDASEITEYRKKLKNSGGDESGITITDMILYAVSRTLINHPDLNANMIDENTIRQFDHVHLGLAVDTPRGLIVPTIFNADLKSLLEISREAKMLAEAARTGSINPDLLKGGTFTVSNLGSYGVEMFTPVINPPQTGILGVCSIVQRVREVEGRITTYPAMGLSLTYDHRAVDGAPAARFMSELVKNLENFTLLLAK